MSDESNNKFITFKQIRLMLNRISYMKRFQAHLITVGIFGGVCLTFIYTKKAALFFKHHLNDSRRFHDEMEDFMYSKELKDANKIRNS